MSKEINNINTKRFVIRKSLIGKHTVITFVNKKSETVKYNHDEVYTAHKERFEVCLASRSTKTTRIQMQCQHSVETYNLSNL
jgi:hypothetical protein